jgi:hypothetical protein
MSLINDFLNLSDKQKRYVHITLCEKSLVKWNEYISNHTEIEYIDSVCGTKQKVDINLLKDAFDSVVKKEDKLNVKERFREPIVAMQDDDLKFSEEIEYAYYSIYNLYSKYVSNEIIDDWLIVNQAYSINNKTDNIKEKLEGLLKDAKLL